MNGAGKKRSFPCGQFRRGPGTTASATTSSFEAVLYVVLDRVQRRVAARVGRLPSLHAGGGPVPRQEPQLHQIHRGDMPVEEPDVDRPAVSRDGDAVPVV